MYDRYKLDFTDQQVVHGATASSEWAIEAHKNMETLKSGRKKKTYLTTAYTQKELDLDFLPAAAESYHLSPNPEDYIIVSLPIVTCDVPNRNVQAFSLQESSYFDPKHGRMVYETFKHKPTHRDHINEDPTQALGVHIDSSLQYIPEYDLWKISVLTMWDRTKEKAYGGDNVVQDIIDGKKKGYSMGAFVDSFACSICSKLDVNVDPCEHFKQNQHGGSVFGDVRRLAFQQCLGVTFFETSSVADPADSTAWSSDVFL